MAFRNSHPEIGVGAEIGAEAADRRCIPLFPAFLGLLAVMNVVSVVFVLMS
jgi:hypothetical protein